MKIFKAVDDVWLNVNSPFEGVVHESAEMTTATVIDIMHKTIRLHRSSSFCISKCLHAKFELKELQHIAHVEQCGKSHLDNG